MGFLRGIVGIRGIQGEKGCKLPYSRRCGYSWTLGLFIVQSRSERHQENDLMAPPQPEAGLASLPGESFGQNPSRPNSQATPSERHERSDAHRRLGPRGSL